MNPKRWIFWIVVLLGLVGFAAESLGCPVCYGDTDSPMARGAELSILFMAGLTYCVILGGGATFFLLRRRLRRLEGSARAAVGESV